jgi:hypothetical protein
MGRSKKFDYQTLVEDELIAQPAGLSLDELLRRCALTVDRSTLFRHLSSLVEMGRVERVGKARASRYRPLNIERMHTPPEAERTPQSAAQPAPQSAAHPPPHEAPLSASGAARQAQQPGRAEAVSVPVAAPDYGAAVKKAVRTVVRDWKQCNEVNLRIYLSLLVPPEQVEALAAAVKIELAGLRAGNLDVYGLSPADFSRFIASANSNAAGG